MKLNHILTTLSFGCLMSSAILADVAPSGLFCDNMVLQRDMPVPVWGTASPGEQVTVEFANQKKSATADAGGKWLVKLDPLKGSSEPQTMTVSSSPISPSPNPQTVPSPNLPIPKSPNLQIKNILVGEVWLASGQSNMGFNVGACAPLYSIEIASSADPGLRVSTVKAQGSLVIVDDISAKWQVADPTTVPGFSAVSYFFARSLREKLGVPVGIISGSSGGTAIEPFMSRDSLNTVPEFKAETDKSIADMERFPEDAKRFPIALAEWMKQNKSEDIGNAGLANGWNKTDFDDSSWTTVTVPKPLKGYGMKGGGIVWLRKAINLPESAAGKVFAIGLNWQPQCTTQVYFNGILARDEWQCPPFYSRQSRYVLPSGVAKAGSNVVAIRMYGLTQDAAFTGETKGMGFPVAEPASLDSSWKFKVEAEFPPLSESAKAALPVAPSAQLRNTATTLFNGMIHPLIPYAIRGVIWYQGESNVGNASTYKQRLKLFIADLRKHWDNPKMPFYIVQLANYYGTHPEPIDSRIAAVRQAQFETVRETPATGMAVAIDVGEVGIHPKRKKPVGERLALVALSQTYGMPGEFSGPLYLSAKAEGDKMRVSFEHTTGGLLAKGGALKQFAIAGEDKKFVWADAVINGNTVVVSSPKVPKPVAVRYAWDDNPEGRNLYNGADLPASPFRTDNW